MSLVRHSENRPGQDPQIFSSGSNTDFSNACDCLGKIPSWRARGKNLNGSNQRTVFRMANPNYKSLNHLPHNTETDINQKPSNAVSVFSRQAHIVVKLVSKEIHFDERLALRMEVTAGVAAKILD